MPKYYAVANGRRNGVYNSWNDCKEQVNGYSGAKYKSFHTEEEAKQFIDGNNQSKHHTEDTMNFSLSRTHRPVESRPLFGSNQRNRDIGYYSDSSDKSGSQLRQSLSESSGHSSGGHSESEAVVYTDGACSRNGFAGAKAGIGVYWGDGHEDNISEPLEGKPTNNRAEIKAAVKAIEQAKQKGFKRVTVRTDSNFLRQSATDWIPKWQRNGWKKSDGSLVKNKDDFSELITASKGIEVKWDKVAAHRGIHGNEEADRLANEGMNKRRKL